MKELDKSKIYDLTELNNEELQQVLDFLRTKYENWLEVSFKSFSEGLENVRLAYGYYGWIWVRKGATANAKELFYTLENVQVDCTDLTEDQIEKVSDIYHKNKIIPILTIDGFITHNCSFILNIITYEKFMELFGSEESNFKKLVEVLNEELTEEAYKETDNKLNYELDFNFITQLAERMAQNKHKYEPYNWQKLDNIAELKQALYRHVMEVMKGNYADDNRLFGHLESLALNAMFINYQLKKL